MARGVGRVLGVDFGRSDHGNFAILILWIRKFLLGVRRCDIGMRVLHITNPPFRVRDRYRFQFAVVWRNHERKHRVPSPLKRQKTLEEPVATCRSCRRLEQFSRCTPFNPFRAHLHKVLGLGVFPLEEILGSCLAAWDRLRASSSLIIAGSLIRSRRCGTRFPQYNRGDSTDPLAMQRLIKCVLFHPCFEHLCLFSFNCKHLRLLSNFEMDFSHREKIDFFAKSPH